MPTMATNLLFAIPFIFAMIVLVAGIVILNGVALWKAARNGSKGWFIALLLTNTIILEILYVFVFSKSEETSRLVDGSGK
ncbi:MAG: hypothetical protein AUJ19_00485 [Parcubacteria group bacterium CG1_02_58_44]|nr:MAG: hypothetical protein AUJ19_00485 [Parcubacteria group bacterium CG1_02_58_44]